MTRYAEKDGHQWTWSEVRNVLFNHSIPQSEFVADFGIRRLYSAEAVRAWLGY
jgi:hypothetical protein